MAGDNLARGMHVARDASHGCAPDDDFVSYASLPVHQSLLSGCHHGADRLCQLMLQKGVGA